jgi:hypothetical protein
MFVIAFGLGWFVHNEKYIRSRGQIDWKLDSLFIWTVYNIIRDAFRTCFFTIGNTIAIIFFRNTFTFHKFQFTGYTGLAGRSAAISIIIAMSHSKNIHRDLNYGF